MYDGLTTQYFAIDLLNVLLPLAARSFYLFVIPQLHLEHFGSHGFDIFGSIFFGNSCQDQQTFADSGYELAIDSDRSRLDPLNYGFHCY